MKLDHFLNSHIKINSKWITDLDITDQTIKLLEKNVGENLHDLRLGKGVRDRTPKDQVTKEKMINWTSSKFFKKFVLQRIPNKIKRHPTE